MLLKHYIHRCCTTRAAKFEITEMLSPLMLRLELQNMKISHIFSLQTYIIKYILFIVIVRTNFGLDPKQDWVLAQQSQIINL